MAVLILQSLLDPSVSWIFIPLTALAIPIIAILVKPMTTLIQRREREEARKLYERIVMEKLDVMKTAIAMGYSHDDLSDLDTRLEKLVGSKKIKSLLNQDTPKTPLPDADLLERELLDEVQSLKDRKSKEVI